MNKPVIFRFTTQKEKHNTYLYFINDKQFPYHVYATAYEIIIDIPEERVINFVKEIRTAGRNTQGVRIIKLSGDEKVVSAIKIDDNLV